jgi:hypothetical protein
MTSLLSILPSVRRVALATAPVLVLASCAMFTSHEDVAMWRATRQNTNEEERLSAIAEYAHTYPNGAFAPQAQAELAAHEENVWESGNATVEGLQYYLTTYPTGTYVAQATERLDALSTVSERRVVEETHVEDLEAARAAEVSESRRLWAGRAVEFWARTLLPVRNFGSPIAAVARANPDFSRAFGEEPAPLCTPTACIKHYHGHFAIPNPGGTRIERDMHLYLRLILGERGRVDRVEVLMPNKGFSRWYEMENRVLVTDEDPEQRQAAIEWVLGRLEPIIAELATGGRAIDVVPEAILPISAADRAASETAVDAGDDRAPAAPAEATAPAPTTAPAETSEIDALLAAAAGGSSDPAGGGGSTGPVEEEAAPLMVFPIALRAVALRNVQVVVFAAADEDYGEAYDGFYIEVARD